MSIAKEIHLPVEARPTTKAWLILAMLCVVGCLNYMDRMMITTMRTSIISDMPMTDAQFGLLTSVFLWVYGLLSPLAGFLADRFNRSRVIIISLFVWSAVTWLTAHATSFPQLLATRALMGISEACYIPAALALITDYHKGSTRSLAVGIHMAGIMAGQSLGFVGGWIAEAHHWHYAFMIFGVIGVAYSCLLAFFLRDAPKEAVIPEKVKPDAGNVSFMNAIRELFVERAYIFALLFWTLMGVVNWMIVGWLPTYYKEHFQLSQGIAGLYATGYMYTLALGGVLFGGFISDRWSRTNPRARMLVPAIGLCIAAPCVFIASGTDILAVTIGGFMLFAFTSKFTDSNMMPILCMIANPRYRATGYGVLNLFSCIIGGIGIYAGGMLRDASVNLSVIFKFAALLCILCAVFLFLIRPRYVEREPG